MNALYGKNPNRLPGLPETPGILPKTPAKPNMPLPLISQPVETHTQISQDPNLVRRVDNLEHRLQSTENKGRSLQEELNQLHNIARNAQMNEAQLRETREAVNILNNSLRTVESRTATAETAVLEARSQLTQLTLHAQGVERSLAATYGEILAKKDGISSHLQSFRSELQQVAVAKETMEKALTHVITQVKEVSTQADQLQAQVKELSLRSRLDNRLTEASKPRSIQAAPVVLNNNNALLEDKVVELTSLVSEIQGKLSAVENQGLAFANAANEVKIELLRTMEAKQLKLKEDFQKDLAAMQKTQADDKQKNLAKLTETEGQMSGLKSKLEKSELEINRTTEAFNKFQEEVDKRMIQLNKIPTLEAKMADNYKDLDQRLRGGMAALQSELGRLQTTANQDKTDSTFQKNIQQQVDKVRSDLDAFRDNVTIKTSDHEAEMKLVNEKLYKMNDRLSQLEKELSTFSTRPNRELDLLKEQLAELRFSQERLRRQMDQVINTKTNDALQLQVDNLRSEVAQIKLQLSSK